MTKEHFQILPGRFSYQFLNKADFNNHLVIKDEKNTSQGHARREPQSRTQRVVLFVCTDRLWDDLTDWLGGRTLQHQLLSPLALSTATQLYGLPPCYFRKQEKRDYSILLQRGQLLILSQWRESWKPVLFSLMDRSRYNQNSGKLQTLLSHKRNQTVLGKDFRLQESQRNKFPSVLDVQSAKTVTTLDHFL